MQVHQSTHKTNRRCYLLAGASALALWLAPGAVPVAQAVSCGLSLDDDNATIDTVGGADSKKVFANLACGSFTKATGAESTAVGISARAEADESTAVGRSAVAKGSRSTAVGASSVATRENSTALGVTAKASGDNSTALGRDTVALGSESTAVGVAAKATNVASTALGRSAQASAFFSTALGENAAAKTRGSVALGANSVASDINTVSVGDKSSGLTRRITNVALGAKDNDAVTVKQLEKSLKKSLKKSFKRDKAVVKVKKGKVQTSSQDGASTTVAKTKSGSSSTKTETRSARSGTRSGSGGQNTVSASSFDRFASRTETQIDRLARRDNKLAEGIAVVAALAQPVLLPGQHFAMRAGWGGYDSANAVAFSAAGVIADNLLRSGHGTLALDGGIGWGADEGEVVGRAGMNFGW
jgi:autotransporter adhesin